MVNFDWYRPFHAFRYSEQEIRGWGQAQNLEIEHFSVVPSGISVVMRKPDLRKEGSPAGLKTA